MTTPSPGLIAEPVGFDVVAVDLPGAVAVAELVAAGGALPDVRQRGVDLAEQGAVERVVADQHDRVGRDRACGDGAGPGGDREMLAALTGVKCRQPGGEANDVTGCYGDRGWRPPFIAPDRSRPLPGVGHR